MLLGSMRQWVRAVRERVIVGGGGGAVRGRVALGVCSHGAGGSGCVQFWSG